MLAMEERRIEAEQEPRDLSDYSAWRKTTDAHLLSELDLYGALLSGQTNGFSEALPLPAIRAAMDLAQIPEDDWMDVSQRLLQIHVQVVADWKRKHKASNG